MSVDALRISKLNYTYKSNWLGKGFSALKDISLNVPQGQSFGFLGHNGAGKTTTIKCILDLIKPTSGTIDIFGVSSKNGTSRNNVGYLPEQPYFYDYLTVEEIMRLYATLSGIPTSQIEKSICFSLEKVKLLTRRKAKMRSLSKGLTQRVAMAQAIVGNPQLLILDEPFSGLDPIGRKEFKDLLFDLKEQGVTIFMSSHILDDVEFLCDRALIMSHGEIKKIFDLSDLKHSDQSTYEIIIEDEIEARNLCDRFEALEVFEERVGLRIVSDSEDTAREILKEASNRDLCIISFNSRGKRLEDLFVQLVQYDEARGE